MRAKARDRGSANARHRAAENEEEEDERDTVSKSSKKKKKKKAKVHPQSFRAHSVTNALQGVRCCCAGSHQGKGQERTQTWASPQVEVSCGGPNAERLGSAQAWPQMDEKTQTRNQEEQRTCGTYNGHDDWHPHHGSQTQRTQSHRGRN